MEEIWRDVVDYEGLYKISNLGDVFSYYSNRILSPGTTRDGYKYVFLFKNKKKKLYTIHRLVAESFLDNPNNLPCINHKDENTLNNNVDNLEWCTIQYNNTHNNIHIRKAKLLAKHVFRYNKYGEMLEEYEAVNEAARILNASSGDSTDCCNGKLITYLDSIWSYEALNKESCIEIFNKRNPDRKNNKLSKKVNQYDLDKNFIISYPSTREASRQLNISQSLIASVCRGEHAYTHGFIFEYA